MVYAYHMERTAALQREALTYAAQLLDAQRADCKVRMRMGDAFAASLAMTLENLGLLNEAWKSPAGMILKAYYGIENEPADNVATVNQASKQAIGGPIR